MATSGVRPLYPPGIRQFHITSAYSPPGVQIRRPTGVSVYNPPRSQVQPPPGIQTQFPPGIPGYPPSIYPAEQPVWYPSPVIIFPQSTNGNQIPQSSGVPNTLQQSPYQNPHESPSIKSPENSPELGSPFIRDDSLEDSSEEEDILEIHFQNPTRFKLNSLQPSMDSDLSSKIILGIDEIVKRQGNMNTRPIKSRMDEFEIERHFLRMKIECENNKELINDPIFRKFLNAIYNEITTSPHKNNDEEKISFSLDERTQFMKKVNLLPMMFHPIFIQFADKDFIQNYGNSGYSLCLLRRKKLMKLIEYASFFDCFIGGGSSIPTEWYLDCSLQFNFSDFFTYCCDIIKSQIYFELPKLIRKKVGLMIRSWHHIALSFLCHFLLVINYEGENQAVRIIEKRPCYDGKILMIEFPNGEVKTCHSNYEDRISFL